MESVRVDDLPVGVIVVGTDDRVEDANDAFRAWCGDPDPVGRRLEEFLVPAQDFLEDAGRRSRMMAHPAVPSRAALVVREPRPDGSSVLMVMDATDRLAAGMELRRSLALASRTRDRLELVLDAAIAFAQSSTEKHLTEILAATTARAFAAEESAVYLADERGHLVRRAGANSLERRIGSGDLTIAASMLGDVLTISGVEHARALSARLADAMTAEGVDALIAAPIRHEGVLLGLHACLFHHERTFDEEAAPLADALATQAAQTLVAMRLQARLSHAAMHDDTTGLPNRRMLEVRSMGASTERGIAVVFLDLDGFKSVNDRFGHDLGDEVLREVARRLQDAVRSEDVVARYGGDEFIVVCDGADVAAASELAERLRRAVEEPFPSLPESVGLGASVGIAIGSSADGARSLDQLIRAADQAMYRAKAAGGNRIIVGA